MRVAAISILLGMAGMAAALGQAAQSTSEAAAGGLVRELVKPSAANPAVRQFDENNVVLVPKDIGANVPLVVFLPGTGGKPENARLLLETVAKQGYRVIGLTYDDEPAGNVECPQDPDPRCAAAFRAMRSFGTEIGARSPVKNPPEEAINHRLVSLLQYLDREHSGAGWSAYVTADGRPVWARIILTGLSQGAGMAAYIAKFERVDRVVLFSSPWDVTGRDKRPAPWLYRDSVTPMDRWWAERHAKENTTEWLAHAYAALQIPRDHLLLFDAPLNPGRVQEGDNPYHGSTIKNPAYVPQWRQMFGEASAVAP